MKKQEKQEKLKEYKSIFQESSQIIIFFVSEGNWDDYNEDDLGVLYNADAYMVNKKDVFAWAENTEYSDSIVMALSGGDRYDNEGIDELESALDNKEIRSRKIKIPKVVESEYEAPDLLDKNGRELKNAVAIFTNL